MGKKTTSHKAYYPPSGPINKRTERYNYDRALHALAARASKSVHSDLERVLVVVRAALREPQHHSPREHERHFCETLRSRNTELLG